MNDHVKEVERTTIAVTTVESLAEAWAFVMEEIEGHERPEITIRPISTKFEYEEDWSNMFEVAVQVRLGLRFPEGEEP